MDGCLACDLTKGRVSLPGGVIHRRAGWAVEHCVGPLGVGTLIVKPERHVERVAHPTEEEAAALGPLLVESAAVVEDLVDADQVYVCLWSHAGRRPGHLHFVIQPADRPTMERFDAHGPALQTAMFEHGERPDPADVRRVADAARRAFTSPSRREVSRDHWPRRR